MKITIDRSLVEQALDAIESDTVLFSAWTEKMVAARTALKAALAEPQEPVQEPDNGGKTGWPPGLLQDDCRGLSKWLASRPDARQRLREALAEPVQEPVACEWPSCGCRVDLGEDWKACSPEAALPQNPSTV